MIELQWDDIVNDTIIWQVFENWTWDAFHQAIDRTQDMVDEREDNPDARFDLVVLMPKSFLPSSNGLLSAMGRGMRAIAKYDGTVVVVAHHTYHRIVVQLVRHGIALVGTRLYAVSSLEEAREQIKRDRQNSTS